MKKRNLFIMLVITCCIGMIPILSKEEKSLSSDLIIVQNEKSLQFPTKIKLSPSNEEIDIEQYVMGVVAGEMPASFHLEALKAQAIAARTYAIYQSESMTKPIKISTAHQVYFPVNNLEITYQNKIKQAVEETKYQILTYQDEVISAMFHASSNGKTESAENYGGFEIPYLTSVQSPEQKTKEFSFTLTELNKLLKSNLTTDELQKVQLTKNNTGRIATIKIGEQTWTGREFRDALSLASTDFQLSIQNNLITFVTVGYGHGVGMSQEGANLLANSGYSFKEILQHYYQNTEIIEFIPEDQ